MTTTMKTKTMMMAIKARTREKGKIDANEQS